MSKKRHYALLICSSLAVMALAAAALLYAASRHVPEYYVEAIEQDAADQAEDSHEFLVASSALASDIQREGAWQSRITAAQINGWLAVDRVENHPDLLAPEIVDPRVAIEDGLAKLAFRYVEGKITTVVSLEFEVSMREPNVVALRIHKARAGALPIPLGDVLEKITASATELGLHVRWLDVDGDPTAWITLPSSDATGGPRYRIDSLQLRDGSLVIAGGSEHLASDPAGKNGADANPNNDVSTTADQSAGSSMLQR